ncbi:MAG: dockerin type I repeat-containing protein [Planctomycetaceae bacterium]|nr:dockerin type I repeat-containing protein [Planctomycetaceae bacterium]
MPLPRRPRLVAAAVALCAAGIASAAVVFTTNGPFGGFFGLWGADLNPQQKAAARFVPTADHTFDDARVWLMNNSGSAYGQVTLRLELDATDVGQGGVSRPSGIALEEWSFPIQTLGWNPVQHTAPGSARPALRAGRKYWIVASSPAPSGANPVWNFASSGNAYTAILQLDGSWAAGSSAALTLTVNGAPGAPKKGDIDRNGAVNAKDLSLLLTRWASTHPAAGDADTNQDGIVNALDLADLLASWG